MPGRNFASGAREKGVEENMGGEAAIG